MKKELILHIIDSLTMGGAETQLKNAVNLLTDYRHLVLYLYPQDDLVKQFEGEVEFICLHHKGWSSVFSTVGKVKKIIAVNQPLLVHSHLFVSSVCARLATPKDLPLLITLHSTYSRDAFQKNRNSIWAEKLTLKKRHTLIAVSNYVLQDYLAYIPFAGRKMVLYNFLPDQYFSQAPQNTQDFQRPLKCIAVGNLKEAKNYPYLLEIFSHLKDVPVKLDIFGGGALKKDLEEKIRNTGIAVNLCGKATDLLSVYKDYDLFIQASSHEGFGLSVIEGMASGLPLMLSDIPVFREITANKAHFFPLNNSSQAAEILKALVENREQREKYVHDNFTYCREQYAAATFRKNIISIYDAVTSKDKNSAAKMID